MPRAGIHFGDVPLVEFLYLLACQVRVAVGDSGLCYCACVKSFERQTTPLFAGSA